MKAIEPAVAFSPSRLTRRLVLGAALLGALIVWMPPKASSAEAQPTAQPAATAAAPADAPADAPAVAARASRRGSPSTPTPATARRRTPTTERGRRRS